MAKGKICPQCGYQMYAEREDKQPKGNWVYYRCRDKTCDFLEKVFESSIIVFVVSGYSKYYSNSIKPLEWKCKCGNTVPDDRNFCVQYDRERPKGS